MHIISQFFLDYPETIFDCGTMLVAAISAFCAFLAYRNQRARGAKSAACELAKYYADNIIERYSFIDAVYSSNGFTQLIKNVFPIASINEFTYQEMLDFLRKSDKTLPLIEKSSSISEEAILKYKLRYTKSTAERAQYMQEHSQQVPHKESEPNIFLDDLRGTEVGLLNDLEWFSMQCRYGVADEKLLYQSLHQTFLAEVQLLYLKISERNTESEDKYYTNIIWLFRKWRNRLKKYRKKNQRAKERANRTIEKAKAKAKYAGNSIHHGRSI